MGQKLHDRIELWKKSLLDFSKRNRLINFKEVKRSNVKIVEPSCISLFKNFVNNEKEIVFPYIKDFYVDNYGNEYPETIVEGNVKTSQSCDDLQKILNNLRYKSKTSREEQGVNTLYLVFGILRWKEQENSESVWNSPIILVPVKLSIESLASPYKLNLHEDEIVVNPTLRQKMENDFGIVFPDFDENEDIEEYLSRLTNIVSKKNWEVQYEVHLTNLSFLKINMYKDLERNEHRLNEHPVISAIVGEGDAFSLPKGFDNFDHDRKVRPIDTFQVVDADSSQLDAILLAKNGKSFVLQGPPGTGKSQTITNIISEAIADGKKVLFVSEKMAALQVVYNRLTNAGLSDFCLALHNHKVKRKDILRELEKTTSMSRIKVKEEALRDLKKLEYKREELNEYQEELHTPCSKLNVSIFYINGLLAKLGDVQDLIFDIPDIANIDREQLEKKEKVLEDYSNTIGKRSEDYSNNVWRGANVDKFSHELQQNIKSKISDLIPLLENMKNQFVRYCNALEISFQPSIDNFELLIQILNFVKQSPLVPVKWIFDDNIADLVDSAKIYKKRMEEAGVIRKKLEALYDCKIFEYKKNKSKDYFVDLLNNLHDRLSIKSDNELAEKSDILGEKILKKKIIIQQIYDEASNIAALLGMDTPLNLRSLKEIMDVVKILKNISDISITDKWLYAKGFCNLRESLYQCKNLHEEYIRIRQSILQKWDKEIFDEDYYPILKRFRRDYGSFFRIFKSSYRRDMRMLIQFVSDGTKLTYADALNLLNTLKVLADKKLYINNKEKKYIANYGEYYKGIETRWDELEKAISKFELVVPFVFRIPSNLKDALISKSLPFAELKRFDDLCAECSIEDVYTDLNSLLSMSIDEEKPYEEIVKECDDTIGLLNDFSVPYREIQELRVEKVSCDIVFSECDDLKKLRFLEDDFKERGIELSKKYEEYYSGKDTNWEDLITALCFAEKMKSIAQLNKLPDSFVQRVCSDKVYITYCRESVDVLERLFGLLKEPFDWFSSLFNDSTIFRKYSYENLIERITSCRDKMYLLEEWLDYCRNKQQCKDLGLSDYIEVVEKNFIDSNIVEIYKKRFYYLWLDMVLSQFQAVSKFRGRIQKQNIEEFCRLDKIQFQIAQARIQERVISRIPDFNAITAARDEVGILKRELRKQRRFMSLRKLFASIPNLITSLRPCFMMSPLSVSIYLEANAYEFDMVIFDEASQVHTEDAIGAIMRGKQIIIVGDTKQLPPTNFFRSSLGDDDDFDDEKEVEYNDTGIYESILDEAITVLPERTLRWHYRSRHEHLIAFSNIKIYNNSLITFPSLIDKAPDNGVEYVYVPDGIYDRSGKRNNKNEAERVVDLIFEHFNKYPKRSLGVVAFSKAQQDLIEDMCHYRRKKNPIFEKFFVEEGEEPFFIKNLENVQGDERDTIIFSIGYARDENGRMYMNLGPLSKEGGHRRLNVAITRAKYNIKLVGSILPTDIDIDKVSAEGVKLLRAYIEFAQLGINVLKNEFETSTSVSFDSPFEEAVYDFLISKGYNVVTQVGCSGFRIDMAVKHPVLSGKFVIGIECDGAMYHSARTARERDRLRQDILENMGWTIYRIWSTDWVKDQKTEEDKLISAIENAINGEKKPESCPMPEPIIIDPVSEPLPVIPPSESKYGFIEYQEADVSKFSYSNRIEVIKKVVEMEQPIHVDVLCRRIAPIYNFQRVSGRLRYHVEEDLKHSMAGYIKRLGKFVVLCDFDFDQIQVRISSNDYSRPIETIYEGELIAAMKIITSKSYGIRAEDLLITTARELGYQRMGNQIESSLRKVYNVMLQKGILKEVDGKVKMLGAVL